MVATARSTKSVLVVDDMRMVRMRLKLILGDMQITRVEEAADGQDALERLRLNPVDLVLSDWNMPRLTGIELLKAMREDPKLAQIPVIFITSEAQKSAFLDSLALNVSEYIVKPFADEEVKLKVTAVLEKSNG